MLDFLAFLTAVSFAFFAPAGAKRLREPEKKDDFKTKGLNCGGKQGLVVGANEGGDLAKGYCGWVWKAWHIDSPHMLFPTHALGIKYYCNYATAPPFRIPRGVSCVLRSDEVLLR
ncbi:unnamed protein product [Sphenostylis stenocarpa]|uniref:Secreted protein n=1 Tax=Sphenostylis stenocarpa TaxID=92480 RepID=A0AA86T5C3_9FABA|nr:unnamed protein product [Sphenostylis stenocarpa]